MKILKELDKAKWENFDVPKEKQELLKYSIHDFFVKKFHELIDGLKFEYAEKTNGEIKEMIEKEILLDKIKKLL